MRIKALTCRILKQIINDKRTIALILFAPIILLTLVYYILNYDDTTYKIGLVNVPEKFETILEDNEDYNIDTIEIDKDEAKDLIKDDEIIAAIEFDLSVIKNSSLTNLKETMKEKNIPFNEPEFDTDYVYGNEDSSEFDNFGAPLIGIIVFFFVFLIAGINFLTERTSGTLEKLLSTPIRRREIIIGYVLGFSILAIIQTSLITFFVVYVLKLTVVGSIWYVLLISLLTAITALTFGILLSTLANSEFQMVQFIPLVILPQIFLCGLFALSDVWRAVGHAVPLYYTTNALTEVIIKGNGFSAIWFDCLILILFSAVFMIVNAQLLRKQRRV